MTLDIVVGAQWGDEGKGHITDLLAAEADIVARFSGGDNAGHTVTIGDETYKLHLIPSGVAHREKICCLGNGMVINPSVLLKEIDSLSERGVDVDPQRLRISLNAHLITPGHVALDKAHERSRGGDAIGTTMRGIGPAYTDKTNRTGLRASLLTDEDRLIVYLTKHLEEKNRVLSSFYGEPLLNIDDILKDYAAYAKRLGPYIEDVSGYLSEALSVGRKVLAEGAQGTLLDLDHGTYPFVTSSWPTAAGALIGLGVGPLHISRITGVAKAFTTRVGGGPFPTEQHDRIALDLRGTGENPWDEFGTTTGRPRRVGWLDLNMLRYSSRINGFTDLALTKLDILTGFKEIPVCVAYMLNGKKISHFPTEVDVLERCEPIFRYLPGWKADISGVQNYQDLPANAQRYVNFLSEFLGLEVSYVSVGPKRQQVLTR